VELFTEGRVLVLSGPLDHRSTTAVREAIAHLLAAYDEGAVLDLADVPWVDATALAMLTVTTQNAEIDGRRLALRGCSDHLRRVLHHARIRVLFDAEDDAGDDAGTG
jgi:anti-anti-sigma factor